MPGEFRGDFTRDTYDKSKQFLRVLMQQGRVQLDADFNEQVSILLHYLQALATDIIGWHGGPSNNWGFEFIAKEDQLEGLPEDEKNALKEQLPLIGKGRYYVEGLLCENDTYVPYTNQPNSGREIPLKDEGTYLAYLDVWERHITYIEDEDESKVGIREVALGGADTATRSTLVWQVKLLKVEGSNQYGAEEDENRLLAQQIKSNNQAFRQLLVDNEKVKPGTGKLKAKAKESADAKDDPCIISPQSSYRGAENQLYRVEIHKSGEAGKATFKWSRENGSVVFPIRNLAGSIVTLEHLGRDSRFSLHEGDWVEIVDDDYILQNCAEPLLKVEKIDPLQMQVTLSGTSSFGQEQNKHPLLRRWDHWQGNSNQGGLDLRDGAALVKEGTGETNWLILEDGIQIQFQPAENDEMAIYQTGDYWLIPARTATGDVEWPGSTDDPEALPPHGVKHHYAPLAIIVVGDSQIQSYEDCRCQFSPLGCNEDNQSPDPNSLIRDP